MLMPVFSLSSGLHPRDTAQPLALAVLLPQSSALCSAPVPWGSTRDAMRSRGRMRSTDWISLVTRCQLLLQQELMRGLETANTWRI